MPPFKNGIVGFLLSAFCILQGLEIDESWKEQKNGIKRSDLVIIMIMTILSTYTISNVGRLPYRNSPVLLTATRSSPPNLDL